MSDIKSGSENVKSVFRISMSDRTSEFLKKLKFSNAELVEILTIADKIELHGSNRDFFRTLILSQSGPFNSEVFKIFMDKLFSYNSLFHLLKHSTDIDLTEKQEVISYFVLSDFKQTLQGIENGELAEIGLDPISKEFNYFFARALIKHSKQNNNYLDSELATLFKILDTFSEAELIELFKNEMRTLFFSKTFEIISKYKKMPSYVIEAAFKRATRDIEKTTLAALENCPLDIKIEVFNLTGDSAILPKNVGDIFIF